jgi:hypothetical protein
VITYRYLTKNYFVPAKDAGSTGPGIPNEMKFGEDYGNVVD